jgi:hypothetical protein
LRSDLRFSPSSWTAFENGISFFFQDRYIRGLLRRPDIAAQFSSRRQMTKDEGR